MFSQIIVIDSKVCETENIDMSDLQIRIDLSILERGMTIDQRSIVRNGRNLQLKEFDVAKYNISHYEVIEETESLCQMHYVIDFTVADRKNKDMEGVFHITSTWKKISDKWKMVFNMDSRIIKS